MRLPYWSKVTNPELEAISEKLIGLFDQELTVIEISVLLKNVVKYPIQERHDAVLRVSQPEIMSALLADREVAKRVVAEFDVELVREK